MKGLSIACVKDNYYLDTSITFYIGENSGIMNKTVLLFFIALFNSALSVAQQSRPLRSLQPSVVNFTNGRVYSFIVGDNGSLFINYWNGSAWQWEDHGSPPGTTIGSAIGATALLSNSTIYAFVRGENGHLYVRYGNGSSWSWADQGVPKKTVVASTPSAVTIGTNQIYVFVRGGDGALYTNFWNGFTWQWLDRGSPKNKTLAYNPAAVVFHLDEERAVPYVFVTGTDGRLYVNYSNGSSWQWDDRGTGGSNIRSSPAVTNYRGNQLYTFANGEDGKLYVCYWNGSSWQWANQGSPQGITFTGIPSVAVSNQNMYVFNRGNNNRLYLNRWNGSVWQWLDQGVPQGSFLSSEVGTVVTQNGIIHAIGNANTGELYSNQWDGSFWRWVNVGNLNTRIYAGGLFQFKSHYLRPRATSRGDVTVHYMEIDASVIDGGTRVQFHPEGNPQTDKNKHWMVIPAGKNAYDRPHYFLINAQFKKSLDNRLLPNQCITAHEGTGNINQKWYLEPRPYELLPGGVYLRSAAHFKRAFAIPADTAGLLYYRGVYYKVLWFADSLPGDRIGNEVYRPVSGSFERGSRANYAAQDITPSTNFQASRFYYIVPEFDNGKALGIPGQNSREGQALACWQKIDGARHQQWQFIHVGRGYWQIKNRQTGLMISVGDNLINGGHAIAWANESTDSQKWLILPIERHSDYYYLFNINSGRALTVQRNGEPGLGTGIIHDGGVVQWMLNNRDLSRQMFKLVPVQD